MNKIILLILVLYPLVLFSQSPSDATYWQHWGVNDGLPQSDVKAIEQDRLGFIWIITQAGVSVLIGKDFHTWDASTGISPGLIKSLRASVLGDTIWAGTSKGIYGIKINKNFNAFFIKDTELYNINSLIPTKEGILAGTQYGIRKIPKTKDPHNFGIQNKSPTCLAGTTQNLYAGYNGEGIIKLIQNKTFPIKPKCNVVAMDYNPKTNCLWGGTANDSLISCWRQDVFETSFKIKGAISSVKEDFEGNLWIGTNIGLFYVPANAERLPNVKPEKLSITGNTQIHCIFQSRDGVIWVGTERGLFIFCKTRPYFILPKLKGLEPFVFSILPDSENNRYMWAATTNQGLQRIDLFGKEAPWRSYYKIERDTVETRRLASIRGKLWAGTSKGVYKYVQGKLGLHNRNLDPEIPVKNVAAIYYDSINNVLWVAARRERERGDLIHCYSFDEKGALIGSINRSINLPRPISVYLFFRNQNDDKIWIGTSEGLYHIPNDLNKYQENFFSPDSIKVKGFIISIYSDRFNRNILWVGKKSGGLTKYEYTNTHTLPRNYSKEINSLADNTINAITQDKDENLWLSTNHGLVRFNQATETFATFNHEDGIPEEYNAGAVFNYSDTLYFGGVGGLVGVIPNRPAAIKSPSYLVVKGEKGFNHLITERGSIFKLQPGDDKLALLAVSPDYRDFRRNTFSFLLLSFFRDTIKHEFGTQFDIPPLPIGRYRLLIKPEGNAVPSTEGLDLIIYRIPSLGEWCIFGIIIIILSMVIWQQYMRKKDKYFKTLSGIINQVSTHTRLATSEEELYDALYIALAKENNLLKNDIKADVFSISVRKGNELVDVITIENGDRLDVKKHIAYPLSNKNYPAVRCFNRKTAVSISNYPTTISKNRPKPIAGGFMKSVLYVPLLSDRQEPMGVATLQAKKRNAFSKDHQYFLESLSGMLTFGMIQQIQTEKARMQLKILTPQMMPHFLSRAFSILANQSREREKQSTFANKMSFISRAWLDAMRKNEGFISIEEDLRFINEYVEAAKIRLMIEEIEWRVSIESGNLKLGHLFIPVLLFQPYIENAFVHGLKNKFEQSNGQGGKLTLQMSFEDNYFRIVLTDNGIGMLPETETAIQKGMPVTSGDHVSESLQINRDRIEILNKLYPGPSEGIILQGPENLVEGVKVEVAIREDLLSKWRPKGVE